MSQCPNSYLWVFNDNIIYHHFLFLLISSYITIIFVVFTKDISTYFQFLKNMFQELQNQVKPSSERLFLGAVYWQWVQIDKRFQRRHMRLGMLVYMGSRFGISYSMLIETKRRHMCLRMLVYIGSRFGIGYCNSDSRCLSKVSKGKGCKCNMCAPTPTHPPTLRI